jgi:hypothetical protein
MASKSPLPLVAAFDDNAEGFLNLLERRETVHRGVAGRDRFAGKVCTAPAI